MITAALRLLLITPLFALLFCQPIFATPDARMALVIGNGAYEHSPLENPVHDAEDMAAALKECDFQVIQVVDADQKRKDR